MFFELTVHFCVDYERISLVKPIVRNLKNLIFRWSHIFPQAEDHRNSRIIISFLVSVRSLQIYGTKCKFQQLIHRYIVDALTSFTIIYFKFWAHFHIYSRATENKYYVDTSKKKEDRWNFEFSNFQGFNWAHRLAIETYVASWIEGRQLRCNYLLIENLYSYRLLDKLS